MPEKIIVPSLGETIGLRIESNRYAKDASALNYYFDRQTGKIVFIEVEDNVLKPPLGFYWFIIEYTKTN